MSSTTHHHHATEPHSANKFHRSEKSSNMHHFSAFIRSKTEMYSLGWADVHITRRSGLNHLSWKSSSKVSRHTHYSNCSQDSNLIVKHHRAWFVQDLTLECLMFLAAVVQCWEWALAYLFLMHFVYIRARKAFNYHRSSACTNQSICCSSAKKTPPDPKSYIEAHFSPPSK